MKSESDLLFPDVNVLIALAWPNHPAHDSSRRRFESSQERWGTCVLTELGFVRLYTNPSVVVATKRPREAMDTLAAMTGDPKHVYLAELPAPRSTPVRELFAELLGHNQVTDAYLLAVARHHGATFLTFDGRMRSLAPGHVEVLTA